MKVLKRTLTKARVAHYEVHEAPAKAARAEALNQKSDINLGQTKARKVQAAPIALKTI